MLIRNLPDIAGIISILIIFASYFLLQIEKWSHKSLPYLVSNFIGALLMIYSLIFDWNLAAFIMEILWALVSFVKIISILMQGSIDEKP